MKSTNIFQLVLMIIFGGFIVGGFLFFVLFKGSNPLQDAGNVTIWGTFPEGQMTTSLQGIQKKTSGLASVVYREKDPRTIKDDILEALAAGKGPDLILLNLEDILAYRDRILFIPFTSYPERTFRDTFFDDAGILVFPDGIAGIPFSYDPIVMYFNRDRFASAGIAKPPQYWDEMLTIVPKLTTIDNDQNVLQSGLAFGESANVDHYKEILSLLILQAGSPITQVGTNGKVTSSLNKNIEGGNEHPGTAALRFFTEFSNPIKTVYSWNRALPSARQMFLSGDLAVYFGYASEFPDLKAANPNLNFDLASVPQSRTAKRRSSYGQMTVFAIPKLAKNPRGALIAAEGLSTAASEQAFITASNLPPVRRDLLSTAQTDAYKSVLYDSAIIGRGWLDPNTVQSSAVFARMIDQVTSGTKTIEDSVTEGEAGLAKLFQ